MIKYLKIKTKRFEVDCGFDPRRKFIQNEELEMEMEFDENFFVACSNGKWALYNDPVVLAKLTEYTFQFIL